MYAEFLACPISSMCTECIGESFKKNSWSQAELQAFMYTRVV